MRVCVYAMILNTPVNIAYSLYTHTEIAYDLYDSVCANTSTSPCVYVDFIDAIVCVCACVYVCVSLIWPRWIQTKRIHALNMHIHESVLKFYVLAYSKNQYKCIDDNESKDIDTHV